MISDRLIYEVWDFAAHVRAAPKWRLCRLIKLAKQAPCSREAANDCCESNKDIRRRRQESREAAHCFEVCKTSKLPCTRSVLPRQGHAFHAMESSRKGDGFILFASAKRTKKQTGFHPATPVQIAGRNGVFTEMTGVHQVTGYAEVAIFHSIDGNDLNRCELQA